MGFGFRGFRGAPELFFLSYPTSLEPGPADIRSGQESVVHGRMSTMISEDLLEALVCPVCRKAVVLTGQSLKCGECRRVYPIEDDIPIMLVDAARIDPA